MHPFFSRTAFEPMYSRKTLREGPEGVEGCWSQSCWIVTVKMQSWMIWFLNKLCCALYIKLLVS